MPTASPFFLVPCLHCIEKGKSVAQPLVPLALHVASTYTLPWLVLPRQSNTQPSLQNHKAVTNASVLTVAAHATLR